MGTALPLKKWIALSSEREQGARAGDVWAPDGFYKIQGELCVHARQCRAGDGDDALGLAIMRTGIHSITLKIARSAADNATGMRIGVADAEDSANRWGIRPWDGRLVGPKSEDASELGMPLIRGNLQGKAEGRVVEIRVNMFKRSLAIGVDLLSVTETLVRLPPAVRLWARTFYKGDAVMLCAHRLLPIAHSPRRHRPSSPGSPSSPCSPGAVSLPSPGSAASSPRGRRASASPRFMARPIHETFRARSASPPKQRMREVQRVAAFAARARSRSIKGGASARVGAKWTFLARAAVRRALGVDAEADFTAAVRAPTLPRAPPFAQSWTPFSQASPLPHLATRFRCRTPFLEQ